MANNPNIYNAIIAGATGASQQRWLTDPVSGNYAVFQSAVVALATVVDDAIEPISGDANTAEAALMQSIVQGVFADRFVNSAQEASYDSIVGPIVALWTELSAALDPGSGGGDIAPLAFTLFCDVNTEVPTESQTGSIAAPFATLQQAHDAFDPSIGGTIVACQGDDDTSYATADFDRNIAIIGLTSSTSNVSIDEIGVSDSIVLSMQNVRCAVVRVTGESEFNMAAQDCDFDTIENSSGNLTLHDCQVRGSEAGATISTGVLQVTDCGIQGSVLAASGIIAVDSTFGGDSVDDVMTAGNQGGSFKGCTIQGLAIEFAIGTFRAENTTVDGEADIVCQAADLMACSINSPMDITAELSASHTQWGGTGEGSSPIECQSANIYACTLTGGLDVTAELLIDTLTYQKALNDGLSVTATGSFIITDPPISATVSINVPAADATTTAYVSTTLVGTDLADLFAVGDAVSVNPAADLVGAGATIASARISAANTLRVGFRGVTTGGAANFTVTRGR